MLISETLGQLKTVYLDRVSQKMNELFLEIEGAELSLETHLISKVEIDPEKYEIVVHARNGQTLNIRNELNDANKRVLTLALIWALMEVSGVEAPRVIDSPLGITSGLKKNRLMNLILAPPNFQSSVPYQVVLFLTRGEINGIEDILSERAGSICTLSSSNHFPKDLVNDWDVDYPVVRNCDCNHRQFCEICERKGDRDSHLLVDKEKLV